MNDLQNTITDAIADAAEVTVTRKDGKAFSGVIVEAEQPGTYRVYTGRRGRPAAFTLDTVESVERQ